MIKKIVSLILIALLLMSMTGCNKKVSSSKPSDESKNSRNVEYQEITSPNTYAEISDSIALVSAPKVPTEHFFFETLPASLSINCDEKL